MARAKTARKRTRAGYMVFACPRHDEENHNGGAPAAERYEASHWSWEEPDRSDPDWSACARAVGLPVG